MPTERFNREQFEQSLPVSGDGKPLWRPLGLLDGEYCYVVPVTDNVDIAIRSSVKSDGWCADTGDDSIRATLVDSIDQSPLATKETKTQRWVARTINWRTNLTTMLREMFKLGMLLGPCPACKTGDLKLIRVKKETSKYKGQLAIVCDCHKHFQVVKEGVGPDGVTRIKAMGGR